MRMAIARQAKGLSLKIFIDKEPKLHYARILGKNIGHSRSTVKIKEEGSKLIIEITAKDTTALRATTNSILRDLQVIDATKIITRK